MRQTTNPSGITPPSLAFAYCVLSTMIACQKRQRSLGSSSKRSVAIMSVYLLIVLQRQDCYLA